jgi:hypothetical protein
LVSKQRFEFCFVSLEASLTKMLVVFTPQGMNPVRGRIPLPRRYPNEKGLAVAYLLTLVISGGS